MKSNQHTLLVIACLWIGAGPAASSARAADFDVPAAFATIYDAVAAAELSADVDNYINIGVPVIFTGPAIELDLSFNALRHLTIRPDPDAGLTRATISCEISSNPIILMSGADYVTIQDLDIVRHITNNNNLIDMSYVGGDGNIQNTIERCRIGSNWTTPGAPGWVYLKIAKPYSVTVRNCVFFALAPGTFDVGIQVLGFDDATQVISLYNNDVADCKVYGIHITDGVAGSTINLRNNVVSNDEVLVPEPTAAYYSNVAAGVAVMTSHNTAFATGANVEQQAGAQSILLGGAGTFLLFARTDLDGPGGAFHTAAWNLEPPEPWNGNPNFFRLVKGGPLHTGGATNGVTIAAVADDIERDPRPSGVPAHTDRGADQLERGGVAATGVAPGERPVDALRASPLHNPASSIALRFESPVAGLLSFEVFDLAGRRLHSSRRSIGAASEGVLEWREGTRSGVFHYRVTLETENGRSTRMDGRVVVIQ